MQISARQRIALFLFSLVAAVALSSIPLYAADDSGYTIRTNVDEVRLAFAASDRQGHAISNLRPADIAVADNSTIIRQFRSFRSAAESPVELVILLDASDSVATQIPQEIAAVKNFVNGSQWGDRDRVSILAFGGLTPELLCARNCRSQIAQTKLNSLRADGATPLYDALFEAAEMLKQDSDPESRPAMILFSDGVDTISMRGIIDVIEASQNLQSAIYSVNSRSVKIGAGRGDTVLQYLAANTGGLCFSPGQDVSEVLRNVLADLHSGYVLTYEPAEKTNGQHSVRILPTADPRLQFRARSAYDGSPEQ
jgi:VWFA-related protein